MRIEQLRHFWQIAHTGSFSAAAQNLYIAQPSLSESIKRLEEELGYPLFKRSRKGITLTRRGQDILPIVTNVLQEIDAIYAMNDQYCCEETLQESFSISTISSIKTDVQNALIALNQNYPQITANVSIEPASQILASVGEGECDLGILNMGKGSLSAMNTADYELQYMFCRSVYFIAAKDSPLAAKKSLSLSAAAKQSFSVFADGKNYSILNYLFGSRPHVAFSATDFSLTLNHIRKFGSIGLLLLDGRHPLPPAAVTEEFVLIPLREPMDIDFYSYYSKSLAPKKKEIIHRFLDYLEELLD